MWASKNWEKRRVGVLGRSGMGLCDQDLTLHLAFMSLQSPLIYDSFSVVFPTFNLHFPNDRWCWTCLFTICVFSLVRFWFLKLGCFSLLSLEHSLCILDTYPLSDMSFAKIFSQFVGCLFILLAASFTEKFFNVIKYIQITFCFFGFFF